MVRLWPIQAQPIPLQQHQFDAVLLVVIAASAKRAAVAERDEGLTAFPIWAGRERQRPGGDKSGRRPTAFF